MLAYTGGLFLGLIIILNISDFDETKSGKIPFIFISYVPKGFAEDTKIVPEDMYTSIKSTDLIS